MPANTNMAMFLTGCETERHILKYGGCELLCVRVANLHRNKYARKHTKSDVIRQYMYELSTFLLLFYVFA